MMRAARLFSTVLATGCIAIASGYIVENGEATAARIGASLQSPGMARAAVLPDAPALPRPPLATLQATPLPTMRAWAAPQPDSVPLSNLDRSRFASEDSQSCNAVFKASATDRGMIRIGLSAPCAVNEPVTLRHEGLSFTEMTTDTGRMTVEIPALTADARVEAVMPDGQTFAAVVSVPMAAELQRVALVWRGEAGLNIHASEFGADAGAPGHIWAGSPGSPELGLQSGKGYLMTFGDRKLANATRAEVYTFPAGQSAISGTVRLSVEAEISNTNCGGVVVAQTVQPDGFGGMTASDLTLRLPDCTRIGEHLVLKNILRDLKIASK